MDTISVTVGPQTLVFPASMTAEAVENKIRSRCILQGGGLEREGVVVDALQRGLAYEFAGGISSGK